MINIREILRSERQKFYFLRKNFRGEGIVVNFFHRNYPKNALLMYEVGGFKKKEISEAHQNKWQEREIARIFSEHGYNVDVTDYNNSLIHLKNNYDLVLDLIPGRNPVFRKNMNPGCKTIAYLTGSNATFQNEAERKRLAALKERRGVQLEPRRQSPLLTKEIESYSACFMIGNEYNWKTYSEFELNQPYFIRNTGHEQEYKFDVSQKKRNAFLYFGSGGQVHKGLDLLLEIFSKEGFPAELYVCGAFKREKDFEKCYWHELYECDNIHPVGFIEISSKTFSEITAKCVYSILPSCSEGMAGTVLSTMSAGLINVCSRECGFDSDEVIILEDCQIETIRKYILELSEKDMEWVKKESKRAYDIVNTKYTRKDFRESFERALGSILKED